MKKQKQMQKAFGTNEFGFIDFPVKISNVQVSRIVYCKKECSFCFPHGWETSNSTRITNRQRNWKRFRKARWNPSEKERERPDRSRPFSLLGNLLFISLHVLIRMAFLIVQTKHAHTSSHFQIQNLRLMLRRFKITMWV